MRLVKLIAVYTLAACMFLPAAQAAASPDYQPDISWPRPIYHMKQATGVATDLYGNVYVADTMNSRVVKFGALGGAAVWGGPGESDGKFDRPAGIAVSPNGQFVYVADTFNHRIQKFTSSGVHVESWGRFGFPDKYGSGNKEFDTPYGIAVDSAGNVYVADSGNERIQMFDQNGTWIRRWGEPGSSNEQFLDPRGIAVSPKNGDVYVTDFDYTNPRIQQFHPDGQFVRRWDMPEPITGRRNMWGITIDSDGNVYVVDRAAYVDQVSAFTETGTAMGVPWGVYALGDEDAIKRPAMLRPTGIATLGAHGSQTLLVCDTNNDRLREFSRSGEPTGPGEPLGIRGSWGTAPSRFFQPSGVAALGGAVVTSSQSRDALATADRMQANHRVACFTTEGTVTAWTPLDALALASYDNAKFSQATAVSVDASGNTYVAEAGSPNHRVQKLGIGLQYATKWGELGTDMRRFNAPGGLAAATIGQGVRVYVADTNNNRILVFNNTGGWAIQQWGDPLLRASSADGKFNKPQGIAVGGDGKVYVADSGNHRVQYFTADGVYLGKWGAFGNDATHFNSPQGVAVAQGGAVYVADTNNHRIKKFSWDGTPIDGWGEWGADPGQFWNPRGLAVAPDNKLWVADFNNHRIQAFTPRNPTRVTATATPAETAYMGSVEVTATLTNESGTALTNRTMKLYRSFDGVGWALLRSETSTTGAYSYSTTIDRLTCFRWVFDGDATYGSSEGVASAISKARLGAPVAPTRAYKGRYVTVYGNLWPRHTSGTKAVKIYAYRYNGKSWVYKFSKSVPVYNRYSYSRYKGSVRFSSTGRWRIRAHHRDSSHASTDSAYDYITVK